MSHSVSTGRYVASENFIGAFGRRQKAGAKRGVLISGGLNQTALSNMPPDHVTGMLTDDAIPVGYADYSNGATWGNDTGRDRVGQAWTFLKSEFGAKTDKVCLYGSSGGAITLLRWAFENPTNVACFVGLIPTTNLVDSHDNNRGGFAANIETAHGISGTYAGNATITTRDPAQHASSLTSFPIRLYYSNNDTIILPFTVTDFAAAVNAAGGNATTVNMGDFGHGANPIYADELAGFLARYA